MYKQLVALTTAALLFSTIHFSHAANPKERKLYVGSNSTEAILEFNGTVELESLRSPQEKTIRSVIESQLEHIVGPMSLTTYKAVPRGDHTVTDIKILTRSGNTLSISYKYKGSIVLENGPKETYNIYLPINPKKIFSAGLIGKTNPCTDHHYQSEGDFWYFWSPERVGCKLKEGKDYLIVKAKVQRFVNSELSYPEYQNLPDEKGNITIHLLFGMDDPRKDRNPLTSDDINAYNYKTIRDYFIKNGYKATRWSDAQVDAIAKTLNGDTPFVETLQKGKLVYRFFFAPTGINEDSLGFHWFYKDAIENASIMMYVGHSGLGGHLDLNSIEYNLGEQIKFNKARYQIFFFNSCTSYRYYNSAYFARKVSDKDSKGTKMLDIFTNGLSTYFSEMPNSNIALITAVEKSLNYAQNNNKFVSYQTLAKQIDSENLFGINGDEDNTPPSAIK